MSASWAGYHLHYHGDQDLLLAELIAPLLRRYVGNGSLRRFFFVRYLLGGPHLRLRCRWASPEADHDFGETLRRKSRHFFERFPSENSLPEEVIRQRNRNILRHDPSESDDGVYPDHHLRTAPWAPEVNRYGGKDLLSRSTELFNLSSLATLELLDSFEPLSNSAPRPGMAKLALLASQALASGRGLADTVALLHTLCERAEASFSGALGRADHAFQSTAGFADRLFTSLGFLPSPATEALGRGTSVLRDDLAGCNERDRRRILISQLHMTSNRLGLSNAREIYMYRLLFLSAGEWQGTPRQAPITESATDAGEDPLHALVNGTLRLFAERYSSDRISSMNSLSKT